MVSSIAKSAWRNRSTAVSARDSSAFTPDTVAIQLIAQFIADQPQQRRAAAPDTSPIRATASISRMVFGARISDSRCQRAKLE